MKRLVIAATLLLGTAAYAHGPNIPPDPWDDTNCTTFSWSWPFIIVAPCQ
jgi:hypothetical protein